MKSRTIRPEFFVDEELGQCEPLARLLFQGLWCLADCHGRLADKPLQIRVQVLPYDDCDAEALLEQLSDKGLIVRYEVEGVKVIQITGFSRHQKVHQNEKSYDLPEPAEKFPDTSRNAATNKNKTKCDLYIYKGNSKGKGKEGGVGETNPQLVHIGEFFRATPEQIQQLKSEDGEEVFLSRVQDINHHCRENRKKPYSNYFETYNQFRKRSRDPTKAKSSNANLLENFKRQK